MLLSDLIGSPASLHFCFIMLSRQQFKLEHILTLGSDLLAGHDITFTIGSFLLTCKYFKHFITSALDGKSRLGNGPGCPKNEIELFKDICCKYFIT